MLIRWAVAQPGRLFYGWWIVVAGLVTMTLSSGLFYNGFGFYFEPMRQQFGWSRTVLSGAFSLSRLESGFLGPVEGLLIQRFGTQRVMLVGFFVFAGGFFFLAQVNNVLTFYAAFMVLALGSGLAGFAAPVVAINNWFRRNRGKAFGIAMLGLGLGGVIFSPTIAWSIGQFGWETTAMLSAALLLGLGIPLSQIVRYSPEQYGHLPDGDKPINDAKTEDDASQRAATPAIPADEEDFTAAEALRTAAFWIIATCHGLALIAISSIGLHQVAYMETDLGLSSVAAAQVVVVLSTVMMLCQPVGGFLGDRFSKRHIAALCLLGHGAAMVMLANADTYTHLMLYALVQGLSWGTRGPIITAMRGDLFGRKNFALINGFSQLVMMIGMIIGPVLTGYMADNYSYSSGFLIIAAMVGSGSILFVIMPHPKRRPQREALNP